MAATMEASGKKAPHSELVLPISRVRTIMKSSPDVENISQDALYTVTAATELFIKDLTRQVYSSKDSELSHLEYGDLSRFINSREQYKGFLEEIIPNKVRGRDILAANNKDDENPDEEENTGEDDTGEEDTGDVSTGKKDTGDVNTGEKDTGEKDTGEKDTDDVNTGEEDSSDVNTGEEDNKDNDDTDEQS